jgi:hypothetical protein
MKPFNLINLYNAEIKKSNLSNIRGGTDVKCFCGNGAPAVAVFQQGPTSDICICPDSTSYNSTKNKSGNG